MANVKNQVIPDLIFNFGCRIPGLNISQPSLAARPYGRAGFLTDPVEHNRHGMPFTGRAGIPALCRSHPTVRPKLSLSHAAAMHDHFQILTAGQKKTGPARSHPVISSQHYPFADEAFIHALQHVPGKSCRAGRYSPCAKGGRRRSSTTSSPARAIWASSSCPI